MPTAIEIPDLETLSGSYPGPLMGSLPDDPRLRQWVSWLEPTRWPTLIVDVDWRLVWVSDELKAFLRETDETEIGYGLHVVEALLTKAWVKVVTPESALAALTNMGKYLGLHEGQQEEIAERVGEPWASIVRQIDPQKPPVLSSTHFDYAAADGGPPYRVDIVATVIHDEEGNRIGAWANSYMAVRPNLVSLLARGDEAMYERMAKLVEPGRRQAAVMFADLESSGTLSRSLPSSAYFRLVRALTTTVDRVVAENQGVTGKHAGDGVSAFFLVDDLGSPSAAAAAAVETAMQVRTKGREIFEGATPGDVLGDTAGLMNIGLHWGGALYMGQLVPGGRLDVTALGDEVNECARIQDSARGATILASKALLEQLDDDDAAALGLDPEKIVYQSLSEWPTVTEKARRDAGGVAVTEL
jgi:class 3 adenylate cyclase